MIRYRYVLLTDRFDPFKQYDSVNALNSYLRARQQHVIYIEVEAYDDRDPDKRRAWTSESVSMTEWFEAQHDQLYKMIEDYSHSIELTSEEQLHEDIAKATDIRYHQPLNLYLLSTNEKLFCRLPLGGILDRAIAKQFRKVGAKHWKRLTLDLFYDYPARA